MIADGKAPTVDYGITPREDVRLVIKWKVNGAPTTEQVEAELTAATEAATSGSAPETGAEPALAACAQRIVAARRY